MQPNQKTAVPDKGFYLLDDNDYQNYINAWFHKKLWTKLVQFR